MYCNTPKIILLLTAVLGLLLLVNFLISETQYYKSITSYNCFMLKSSCVSKYCQLSFKTFPLPGTSVLQERDLIFHFACSSKLMTRKYFLSYLLIYFLIFWGEAAPLPRRRTKNKLQESIFSFCPVCSHDWTRVGILVSSVITCWGILLVGKSFLISELHKWLVSMCKDMKLYLDLLSHIYSVIHRTK